MILRLTERRWCELAILLYLYQMEDILKNLACLHDHSAHPKDGYKYGCVPDFLFKRLEPAQAELLSLAHTSGVPWVKSLSDSLNEIIAHGEFYPVQDMIQECEEEVMEQAPYQEPRSEEEFQRFLKQMQESRLTLTNAQESCPPGWFVDISQV